ncbi:hypothetical protein B0H10DRAFT_1950412 [Mycena sp. CBHHK59/15]|nr:hypothetical protein B0H10DRAFT_1950412 [Mycena sp. CBHHK59/15]
MSGIIVSDVRSEPYRCRHPGLQLEYAGEAGMEEHRFRVHARAVPTWHSSVDAVVATSTASDIGKARPVWESAPKPDVSGALRLCQGLDLNACEPRGKVWRWARLSSVSSHVTSGPPYWDWMGGGQIWKISVWAGGANKCKGTFDARQFAQ